MGQANFPDMGFTQVVDQIVAERYQPKTMTLLIEVEAIRPVIDAFASATKSAHGEFTELGFAFRELCACARGGRVSLALKGEAYTKIDFVDTQ